MERTSLGAPGLGRVLVVLALAHGALLGAVVLLGAGDDETRRLLSNASFLVWSVVFAGTAVRAWRGSHGSERRRWSVFAAAAFTVTLGNVAWFWYQHLAAVQPSPSLAEVGYLLTLLLLALCLLRGLVERSGNQGPALRPMLDALMVGVGLFAVWWVLGVQQVWGSGPVGAGHALLVAFPVLDVIVLTLALLNLQRGSPGPLRLMAAAMVPYTLADSGWALLALGDGYAPGTHPLDGAWVWAYGLLAASATRAWPGSPVPATRASWQTMAWPFLPALLGLVVLSVADLAETDYFEMALGALLFALGLARLGLLVRDHSALLGSLEAAVVERTAQLRSTHDELARQANTDSLTGLGNRRRFITLLDEVLSHRGRPGPNRRDVTVVLLDVDDFKGVNDAFGHVAGDELLTVVARRLEGSCPTGGVVCRLGGDEFAVLLVGAAATGAGQAVAGMVAAVRSPVTLGTGHAVVPHVSAGVTSAQPGDEGADVLVRADVAVYAAKGGGKNRFEVYDPSRHARVLASHRLQAELVHAADDGQLVLHYQPHLDLMTGRVLGCEALVRWDHPELGLLMPGDFVPDAERSSAIDALGSWVLSQACRQAATWDARHPGSDLEMSVNLSRRQMRRGDLAYEVSGVLAACGLDPSRLVLEVTESALVDDDEAVDVLHELKALGVRVAMDDFGTGYSSLAQLRHLPVDVLKVDRSFVADMVDDAGCRELVRAVLGLADTFALTTVAEGVETHEQRLALLSLGCATGQGWLFGRAVPAAEFAATWLRTELADAVQARVSDGRRTPATTGR